MGGGQPKNTTTTTETKLPDWLVNNYQSFIRQTNDVNAKPYQSYSGQLNAGPSQGQQLAGGLAQMGATYGLPGQAGQIAGLGSVIGGKYDTTVGANPYAGKTTNVGINPYAGQNKYLDRMVANSNQNITDAYNQNAVPALAAQFASGGAFGGSAMQQAAQQSQDTLAKNLAQSTDNLRFQDYTAQQGLAENALNRSIGAQQTDLARNSAIAQQDWQNRLQANQQNATNIINGSQGLNAVNAIQQGYLGQLGQYGQIQQDFAQGNIDQAYNDWYQKNYGYDQQKLNNYGNALNSISGNFQGSSVTGANPAYKPRTAGGALAAGASGAAAGSSFGPWGALIGGVVGAGAYYL